MNEGIFTMSMSIYRNIDASIDTQTRISSKIGRILNLSKHRQQLTCSLFGANRAKDKFVVESIVPFCEPWNMRLLHVHKIIKREESLGVTSP